MLVLVHYNKTSLRSFTYSTCAAVTVSLRMLSKQDTEIVSLFVSAGSSQKASEIISEETNEEINLA